MIDELARQGVELAGRVLGLTARVSAIVQRAARLQFNVVQGVVDNPQLPAKVAVDDVLGETRCAKCLVGHGHLDVGINEGPTGKVT